MASAPSQRGRRAPAALGAQRLFFLLLVVVAGAIGAQASHMGAHCASHEPKSDSSLGCILGPEGDALKVGDCPKDGARSTLGYRLKDTKAALLDKFKDLQASMHLNSQNDLNECVKESTYDEQKEGIKNKLKRAFLAAPNSPDRTITVVAGGSSVTAGHDNLYDQAWPFAFERAASCVFKAAGISLKVRDAALGANQGFQYSMCNSQVMGADADLIIWEVGSMMGNAPEHWELAFRNFMNPKLFPRRPSIIVPDTGVSHRAIWGDTTKECGTDKAGKCPGGGGEVIISNMCPDPNCRYIPCEKCNTALGAHGSPELAKMSKPYYETVGGYNYMPLWCIAKRSSAWEFSGSYMLRIGKQLRQAKGWHFGPYGHKFFGELLALSYLKYFAEVIDEISAAKPADVHGEQLRAWAAGYSAMVGEPNVTFPTIVSNMQIADQHREEIFLDSPQCTTTLVPHQHLAFTDENDKPIVPTPAPPNGAGGEGEQGVPVRPGSDDLDGWAVLLDPSSSEVMDMRDYCMEWDEYGEPRGHSCPPALKKRAEEQKFFKWEDIQKVVDSGKWVVSIVEAGASRGEVNLGFTSNWGWRDRKYVLQGNNKSGKLTLKLHMKQKSKGMMICDAPFCRPTDASCQPGSRTPIVKGLQVEVDGTDVSSSLAEDHLAPTMCLWLAHDFNPGAYLVSFKVKTPEVVNLGHIIWW